MHAFMQADESGAAGAVTSAYLQALLAPADAAIHARALHACAAALRSAREAPWARASHDALPAGHGSAAGRERERREREQKDQRDRARDEDRKDGGGRGDGMSGGGGGEDGRGASTSGVGGAAKGFFFISASQHEQGVL